MTNSAELLPMGYNTDPKIAGKLANLYEQRAALDRQINLIESGISKSAYEANLAWQLSLVNDQRIAAGKEPLTMSAFLAGCDEEDGE